MTAHAPLRHENDQAAEMSGLASSIRRLEESDSFRRERVKSFAKNTSLKQLEVAEEPYDIRAPLQKVVPNSQSRAADDEDSLPKLQAFKLALLQYSQRSDEAKETPPPQKTRRHSFVVRSVSLSRRKAKARGVSERIRPASCRSSIFALLHRS